MIRAKRGLVALAIVLALLGGLVLLRGALTRLDGNDQALGARIYERNCATCHGVEGEGRDQAPPLNPTGHAHHHPDWELHTIVAEGKVGVGEMPGWKGRLTARDIRAVIAYIKMLWTVDQRRFQQEVNRNRPGPP